MLQRGNIILSKIASAFRELHEVEPRYRTTIQGMDAFGIVCASISELERSEDIRRKRVHCAPPTVRGVALSVSKIKRWIVVMHALILNANRV